MKNGVLSSLSAVNGPWIIQDMNLWTNFSRRSHGPSSPPAHQTETGEVLMAPRALLRAAVDLVAAEAARVGLLVRVRPALLVAPVRRAQ